MTTLWHLPEDHAGKNPYGTLLMQSLRARGLRVIPVPYGHLFALHARGGFPDVVHFQFIAPYVLPAAPSRSAWRAIVKGALFIGQIVGLRLAGCRIVWTVHNLVNHERRLARFEWFFSAVFARLAHVLVVHGDVARREVIDRYRLRRRARIVAVVAHPNYIGAYPDGLTREKAREQIGVDADALMVLSLGQLRRYKGLPDLVRAFNDRPAGARAELWIAGEPVDAEVVTELQQAVSDTADVHVLARFLEPDDVERLFKACDVVALPYLSILTSGAAVLAMSYGRPCVVPRLGCLVEVLDDQGAFFYDEAQPDGLRNALALALVSKGRLPAMGQRNLARASEWSWAMAAEQLVRLYAVPSRAAAPLAARGEG